ncbi:MAG TPA: hypothetical protein VF747_13110 [Blastocatellia bacterium]
MKRVRAFCAALALLIGSLSAPIALGWQPSGVCSMTCCVEAGHCCCNPRQPYVEGESPDKRPVISLADAYARCPDGCAGSQSSSQLRLRDIDRAAHHHLNLDHRAIGGSQPAAISCSSAECENHSPRAPPLLLS